MSIQWPDLWNILKPCRGERFAVVRDTVAFTMELVDLERLFVVMSGSRAEQELNAPAVLAARGDVLLLGFGLGFILIPIMNKPEVMTVTVVEREQEVLDLVAAQHVLDAKVRIVLADALTYVPDRQYDLIYADFDYTAEEIGLHSDVWQRLRAYLKPGGKLIEWFNDESYRV